MVTAEDENKQIKNPIQLLGCKITYLRRYLWINALELTEHDSVDALAGKPVKDGKPPIPDSNNLPPENNYNQPNDYLPPPPENNYNQPPQNNTGVKMASEKQTKAIYAISKSVNMNTEQAKNFMELHTGKRSSKDLTSKDASKMIEELKKMQ